MNNNKIDIIKAYLKKSNEKLTAAIELYNKKLYDDSASRSYYAIFHILSAVLFTKDLVYNSHKEVIGNFNKEFIKAEIFPKDFYKKIRYCYENREAGDYEITRSIDNIIAETCLINAKDIIKECKLYLSKIFNVNINFWD